MTPLKHRLQQLIFSLKKLVTSPNPEQPLFLALETLASSLDETYDPFHQAALAVLNEIYEGQATQHLVDFLEEANVDKRRAVAFGLGQLASLSTLTGLEQALNDHDSSVRYWAAYSLGILDDFRAVDALVQALKDEDDEVGLQAANSLAKIGEVALPELLAALEIRDDQSPAAAFAAHALGQIGDEAALEPLLKAFREEQSALRAWIGGALVNFGERAVPALIEMLEDKDQNIAYDAALFLGKIKNAWAIAPLIETFKNTQLASIASQALREFGSVAVSSLVKALREPDEQVRAWAATTLGSIGEPAKMPLVHILDDADWQIREKAVYGLSWFKDKRLVRQLTTSATDEIVQVRRAVMYALGCVGDQSAFNILVQALEDVDAEVRANAVEALGKLPHLYDASGLIAALDDPDSQVRVNAAEALGNFESRLLVEPLLEALRDADTQVCIKAAASLARLGDYATSATLALIESLQDKDPELRAEVAHALGEIGDIAALEVLLEALNDPQSMVRAAAARALGQLESEVAVLPLCERLKDSNWLVRSDAANALAALADSQAVEPLVELLQSYEVAGQELNTFFQEEVNLPAYSALQALIKIGQPALAHLITLSDSLDPNLRSWSIVALREIGDSQATQTMLNHLNEKDLSLRYEAVRALGELGDLYAIEALQEVAQTDEVTWLRSAAANAIDQIRERLDV